MHLTDLSMAFVMLFLIHKPNTGAGYRQGGV